MGYARLLVLSAAEVCHILTYPPGTLLRFSARFSAKAQQHTYIILAGASDFEDIDFQNIFASDTPYQYSRKWAFDVFRFRQWVITMCLRFLVLLRD